MSKLQFCLILSPKQMEASNCCCCGDSYFLIKNTHTYFDNIRDYTLVSNWVLNSLYEEGWEIHKIYTPETPDPLTLDLSTIPHCRDKN